MVHNLKAITGLDGSGKSLQSGLLLEKFPEYRLIWGRYKPLLLKIPIQFFNKINLKTTKVNRQTYQNYSNKKKSIFKRKQIL